MGKTPLGEAARRMLIVLKAGKSYHTFEKMIMKMTIINRGGREKN
jgi:hypothetical protein